MVHLVTSVLSLFSGVRASYNETFCITSTTWGKWSHEDDCRFGGKLPKVRIEKDLHLDDYSRASKALVVNV